jgi:hypothetical protein
MLSTNDKNIQQNEALSSLILGSFASLHILKNSEYDKELKKTKTKYQYIPLEKDILVRPYINNIRSVRANTNTKKW